MDSFALPSRWCQTLQKREAWCAIVIVLALTAILDGTVVAFVQSDFKRLLAFSSIGHLWLCRGRALRT